MRKLVALVTLAAVLGAGCARQAAWPAGAAAVTEEGFAAQARPVTTVDLLPVDLEVFTEAGVPETPLELRDRAASSVVSSSLGALTARAYGVQAVIDAQGDAGGGPVLAPADLVGTLQALAGYGAAVEAQAPAMPVPRLPVKLGQATGSDATLYVGGWAYVAKPRASKGEKVAEGIAIAVVAVVLIGAIVAIAAASKGKGSGGSSGGGGKGGGGGGGGVKAPPAPRVARVGGSSMRDFRNPIEETQAQRVWIVRGGGRGGDGVKASAATAASRGTSSGGSGSSGGSSGGASSGSLSGISSWAGKVRDHRGGSSGGGALRDHRDGGSSGSVRDHRDGTGGEVRDHRGGGGGRVRSSLDLAFDLGGDVTIEVPPEPEPDPGEAPDADPREALRGKHSMLYLEMTLVDNHTGLVLWHAHQAFPASAARRGEVERATKLMLASLPAAVAPSPAR